MAGLDIYQAVGGYLNKELCARGDVSELVASRTREGRLGMKTVWVTRSERTPGHVDVKIANLVELPRMLAQLQ